MPHGTPLITTIVAGIGLAFVFGAIANRLRVPPLVGYLVAGIVVGPYTPGFVADQALAPELAELGVILLMFGVGLHFSVKDLLSVKAIAVPGALVQILLATALGAGLAWAMDWTPGAGLVFGLALSVASTVVLLRALQERRLLESERGRIAVGWLVVEDLAMVLTLVLLPALAGVLGGHQGEHEADSLAARFELGIVGTLALALAKVAAFVALMLIVGKRVIPWTMHTIARTGSKELFRLSVLAIALGVAYGSAKLFGVSLALGAFFAGMILAESELSHEAAEETLPLRDAFSVLFFVAMGMLFDPMSLIRDPLPILATLFIILIGKSVGAFLIVLAFRYPAETALTISASLAQVGEFSFILAELGVKLGLLSEQGRALILGGAILSIIVNPLAFASVEWLRRTLNLDRRATARTPGAATPAQAAAAPTSPAPARPPRRNWVREVTEAGGHAILVGYGRVGSIVAQALRSKGMPFLAIEDAETTVTAMRQAGVATLAGNAAVPDVLQAAGLQKATFLIVAIPNAFEAGQVVEQARSANPRIQICARAHSDAEVEHLTRMGADFVIMGEREIARGMVDEIARRSRSGGGNSISAAGGQAPAQA